MKPNWMVLVLVAAALGAAAGFFAGRSTRPLSASPEGGDATIGRAPERALGGRGDGKGSEGTAHSGGKVQVQPPGAEAVSSAREALKIPGLLARTRALLNLVNVLDEEGLRRAIDELRSSGHESELYILASALAERDPEAAMEYLKRLPARDENFARGYVMRAWAAKDPEAAAAQLAQMADGEGTLMREHSAVYGIATEWARTDPKAALQWALGLDSGSRRRALPPLLEHWAGLNPREAAAHVQEVVSGEGRVQALDTVAKQWAKSDPRAALVWAHSLPPGERSERVGEAIKSWALTAPLEAAEYVSGLKSMKDRNEAVLGLVTSWKNSAPREAAEWLVAQEASGGRDLAASSLMRTWGGRDAEAASGWLAAQAPGPVTDHAIAGFTGQLLRKEPESAFVWAAAITDEALRQDQMRKVAKEWLRWRPEEATQWLRTSELPGDMKEELLSR